MDQPAFRLRWENEDDARAYWTRDAVHFPRALSPMGAAIMPGLQYGGIAAVRDQLALPVVLVAKVFDGYAYSAAFPVFTDPQAQAQRLAEHRRVMDAAIAALPERWQREYRPELERRAAALLAVDPRTLDAPALAAFFETTLAELRRIWPFHFLIVFPVFAAGGALADAYREATGDETPEAPYRLLVGDDNATLEADRALYAIARQAETAPEVAQALRERRVRSLDALRALAGGAAIADALDAYLARYGHRVSSAEDIVDPTWIEAPEHVLEVLGAYLSAALPDPEERRRSLLAERERLEREVLIACSTPEVRERFQEALTRARAVWPLRETHALYIDQMTLSLLRRPLLAAGELLVRTGRLAARDDVFLLTPPELLAALREPHSPSLEALAEERRRDWERQQRVTPPPWIGTPPGPDAPPPDPELLKAFGAPVSGQTAPNLLRGYAASPGKASGPVRVAFGPDDFARVQPGDVLVCPATTPAWTPLFSIIAALVTDSGGPLSHGAIVAREYRLPAVAGVGDATRRLRNGQRVEVDGMAGVVRVLG